MQWRGRIESEKHATNVIGAAAQDTVACCYAAEREALLIERNANAVSTLRRR